MTQKGCPGGAGTVPGMARTAPDTHLPFGSLFLTLGTPFWSPFGSDFSALCRPFGPPSASISEKVSCAKKHTKTEGILTLSGWPGARVGPFSAPGHHLGGTPLRATILYRFLSPFWSKKAPKWDHQDPQGHPGRVQKGSKIWTRKWTQNVLQNGPQNATESEPIRPPQRPGATQKNENGGGFIHTLRVWAEPVFPNFF